MRGYITNQDRDRFWDPHSDHFQVGVRDEYDDEGRWLGSLDAGPSRTTTSHRVDPQSAHAADRLSRHLDGRAGSSPSLAPRAPTSSEGES